jgi:hypothetical protein
MQSVYRTGQTLSRDKYPENKLQAPKRPIKVTSGSLHFGPSL